MVGCIVVLSGAYFSCEQSGSSVMFRMHLFRVLLFLGCTITRVASCSFGSAFNKPYQWLRNKGGLLDLEGKCQCRWKGKHFKVEGSFTRQSISEFNSRCTPDALAVYGRLPRLGEAVSSFSAQYPRSMMNRMAQGRSSSFSISRVLKQNIPYVIGSNLYPGGLHVYSGSNRADGPSRDLDVPPPSKGLPLWYKELLHGDARRFDIMCESSKVPKLAARWLRLLLLLGGDIEPNPGPAATVRIPRGELDLATGFTAVTATRMQKCLSAFRTWVQTELELDFDRVMLKADSTALALKSYGVHLFRSGLPRYMYVYAITAVQDQFPEHRPFLGAAWHVDRKWQHAEPGQSRPVMPLPLLQAAICLALLWDWPRWAGLTLIAFAGMLHPAEFICLRRRDLMFPIDTGFATDSLYIHLRNPKTSRFARQQHVKISDPDVIRFAEAYFSSFDLDEKLFGASIHAYRSQWNGLMSKLGVPFRQVERGVTPGSLRGSGATVLYLMTEDIPLVCWRGRWARLKTLEFYLQEVSAQVLLHSIPPKSQQMISQLSAACFRVFTFFLHEASIACGAGPKSRKGGFSSMMHS
eukprot:Skav232849  [mRNA]  locus=scaffold1834:904019:906102:- [translate_table: standard]